MTFVSLSWFDRFLSIARIKFGGEECRLGFREEAGAVKALQKVGLSDPDANKDIHDLRNLLDDFRSAKKTISTTVVKTITVAIIGLIAAAIWFDFGNPK